MYHYTKTENGWFRLQEDEPGLYGSVNSLYVGPSVAVLYDTELMVLIKHGDPHLLHKYLSDCKNMDGGEYLISAWKLVETDRWKVEELNKIIHNTGYITYLETNPERFVEKWHDRKDATIEY